MKTRILSYLLTALTAIVPAAAAENSDLLAKIHFAGEQAVEKTADGSTAKKVWSLPESARLRDQVMEKFARAWARRMTPSPGISETEFSQLLKPLWLDLWKAEWYAECHSATNQHPAWALAIQLDPSRSNIWQRTVQQLDSKWKPTNASGAHWLSSSQAGGWLVISSRSETLDPAKGLLQKIGQQGRPAPELTNSWISGELDLARIPPLFPRFRGAARPKMEFSVVGREQNLRTEVHFRYEENQPWKLDKWEIPTDFIHDPIISFTAIRNVSAWLPPRPDSAKPRPNQLFLWGKSPITLEVYAAVPVADPTNAFTRIKNERVPILTNFFREHRLEEQIIQLTNRVELSWRGLPTVLPFIRPAAGPSGKFLIAGLFPAVERQVQPPAALFQQVTSRPDVVLYDWEITETRIPQWISILQLPSIVLYRPPRTAPHPAATWLNTVKTNLGNTITEATIKSPREIDVVRKSHVGLNALELVLLTRWMDSADFPKINRDQILQIGQPLARRKK